MDNTTIKAKVSYDDHIRELKKFEKYFIPDPGLDFILKKGEVITITDVSGEIKIRCDHYDKDTGKFEGTVIE